MAGITSILRKLAKDAAEAELSPEALARFNTYRVAKRLSDANSMPAPRELIRELTPIERLKLLEAEGWDTSRPLFFASRNRPYSSMANTERVNLEPSPEFAVLREMDTAGQRLMFGIDNMTPDELAASYEYTRLMKPNTYRDENPEDYAEAINDAKTRRAKLLMQGMTPDEAVELQFKSDLPAVYPVYARQGARGFDSGWSNSASMNDLISVYGVPGDEGKFAKGGKVEVPGYAGGGAVKRMAAKYFDPDAAVRSTTDIVKEPGGQWLAGGVERAVAPLRRTQYSNPDVEVARAGGFGEQSAGVLRDAAINDWLEQKLAKYIRNDMATARDPIRKLAEEGTLHFAPDWVPEADIARGEAHRLLGTDKPLRLGQSQLAQDWEDFSDVAFVGQMRSAGEWTNPRVLGSYTVEKSLAENPWLTKIPPETPVYTTPYGIEESLGFGHLVDELSNALNPESGLPEHLLIDPEKLGKVNIADAVKRVSEINAWRAAQKAELDALRARNPATHLVREYPEQGFSWMELRVPEALPEGWAEVPESGGARFTSPSGKMFSKQQMQRMPLEDALKYEGDVMGHCAGGYCDDVLAGRSRIFSLRDAKGEPHVTVEVDPGRERIPDGYGGELKVDQLPAIVQIKGKHNRAPNAEYLPFVQDFVRNNPLGGQWSAVGDLPNAGLMESRFDPETLSRYGVQHQPYVTQSELDDIMARIDAAKGYAAGGVVGASQELGYNPTQIDAIANQLAQEVYGQRAA